MTEHEDEVREQPSPFNAAATLAMAAASREKADAFLDEQTHLVRLQAKELEHELKLRHWSLRVRHVSDVMKVTFEIAVALIGVILVSGIGYALWSAAHDTGAVIEAFGVPPDMAARGLTGEVIASKLLARLAFLQEQTSSTRAASSYAGNWGDDIKVQIPDTGISVGELNRFLHGWLGHQTRIAGDIYRTADGISVTAHAGDETTPTFTGREADLDSLIDRAARSVYRATQPYRYARYLTRITAQDPTQSAEFAEGIAILQSLTQRGSPEDRAWAYDGLGTALVQEGDPAIEMAMMRKSIAVKPGLDAYDSLAGVELRLGHDEAALKDFPSAVDMARQGITFGLDPSTVSQIVLSDEQILAMLRGDYSGALAFGRKVHEAAAQSEMAHSFDGRAGVYDILSCAGIHDAACFDRVREAVVAFPDAVLDAALELGRIGDATRLLPQEKAEFAQLPRALAAFAERRYGLEDRAMLAAYAGDFANARRLIANTPADCVPCLRNRGRIDSLAGNFGGAAFWIARVVDEAPSLPIGYTDWGELLLREGAYDAAIAKFHDANLKGPHFADPLEMWGEALMQEKRSDLALAKFAEAAKYAPNWGRLHFEWGEALLYTGNRIEAHKQFAIAANLDLSVADRAHLAKLEVHRGG